MSDQYPQDPQQPQDPDPGVRASSPVRTQPGAADPAYQTQPPTMSAEDERTWGAISHAGAVIAMICSAGFLGFVASVAVYLIHKDRGPFVRAHAANSLNMQITMFTGCRARHPHDPVALLTLGLGLVVMLRRSPLRSSSPACCT